ncbi:MAG TPA: hypothetical protein VGK24_05240 [Candidatus Angelobacter sp.]
MNLSGFEKVHESNLQHGQTYYFRNRFGAGFVLASESTLDGWNVELQQDAGFTPPLKKFRAGDIMPIPAGSGTWYEVKS